jgi:hypothetical protein
MIVEHSISSSHMSHHLKYVKSSFFKYKIYEWVKNRRTKIAIKSKKTNPVVLVKIQLG